MVKRLFLGAAAAGLVLAASPAAEAQFRDERIVNFHSDVRLARDGRAQVTETIVYDFGSLERHGIFRYVPVRYEEAGGDQYYLTFTVAGVTDEAGRPVEYDEYGQAGNRVLKIGDPDRTITGTHTYRIAYALAPVVRRTPGNDLFSFDVTGDDWSVPIDAASVTVHAENNVLNLACFTGPPGSRQAACTGEPTPDGYRVRAGVALPPGSGFTVANEFAAGSFERYLEANRRPPFPWRRYVGYGVGAAAALAGLLSLLASALYYRWRRGRETEVPQYESPDKLSPAEIGMMIDNRTGMTEVTATLIDLAVRGYLKIEQTEPPGAFRKAKYRFRRTAKTAGLKAPEQILVDAVFASGRTVDVSTLDRDKMTSAVGSFQSAVRSQLEQKGYYAKARLLIGKWAWPVVGLVVLAVVVMAALAGAEFGNIVGQTAVTFTGLVFFILTFYRARLTAAGYVEWGEVSGFRRFLSMTEKERLAFTDAPKRNPKQFSALLPFAVALGVEKEWARQFEGIDVSKQTAGWYTGPRVFTTAGLAGDLSSFNGAINANFSPVSSSSGGSGGGSSGGGVGGGGGGSW